MWQYCFGNENNFSIDIISFSRKCNLVLVLVLIIVDFDDFLVLDIVLVTIM